MKPSTVFGVALVLVVVAFILVAVHDFLRERFHRRAARRSLRARYQARASRSPVLSLLLPEPWTARPYSHRPEDVDA